MCLAETWSHRHAARDWIPNHEFPAGYRLYSRYDSTDRFFSGVRPESERTYLTSTRRRSVIAGGRRGSGYRVHPIADLMHCDVSFEEVARSAMPNGLG